MIRIRFSTKHWLTYSPDALRDSGLYAKLPPNAWAFLGSLSDEDASHVAVAFDSGELAGWMRCTLSRGRILYAQGTWVTEPLRRQGVAFRLWETALRRLRPKVVSADTISRGGQRLMAECKKTYPDINWSVMGASRVHRAHVNLANL